MKEKFIKFDEEELAYIREALEDLYNNSCDNSMSALCNEISDYYHEKGIKVWELMMKIEEKMK